MRLVACLLVLSLALLLALVPGIAFAVDGPGIGTGLPGQVGSTVVANPAPPPERPKPAPGPGATDSASPAPAPPPANRPPLDPAAAEALGINDFAFDLLREVSKEKPGNHFSSPFSISTALGMTAAGARGGTLAEMEKALRVRLSGAALHEGFGALVAGLNEKGRAGNFELAVANRLFGAKGKPFLPDFLALVDRLYGTGGVHPLDFKDDADGSRKFINDWVAEVTKDKIKDLIPAGVIDGMTKLVLVNAIFFKGNWADQFEKSATRDEPFTADDGATKPVPLMRRTADYGYAEADGVQAVEIPYKKDELSMIAILPPAGTKLADFERDLSWERLKPLVTALRKEEIDLFLPRFKLECDFKLKGPLSALGMAGAFGDAADFRGICDGPLPEDRVKISEVLHKAFVDVNEEGTEAAAATAVVMDGTKSVKPPKPVFRADRPFLFYIRDNATGTILFLGRVAMP